MLFNEAEELEFGDEMYVTDGIGRTLTNKIVIKLAGPFTDGHSSKPVMLVRNVEDARVILYNLPDLVVKPPLPKEGETWIHRVEGGLRSRYIAGVTTNHVVLKASKERPDSRAHAMPLDDFVKAFKRKV